MMAISHTLATPLLCIFIVTGAAVPDANSANAPVRAWESSGSNHKTAALACGRASNWTPRRELSNLDAKARYSRSTYVEEINGAVLPGVITILPAGVRPPYTDDLESDNPYGRIVILPAGARAPYTDDLESDSEYGRTVVLGRGVEETPF